MGLLDDPKYKGASFSTFIPSGELTVTDQKNMKESAIAAGMDRAIYKKLGANGAELAVREIRPSIDLPTAFAAGDRWIFPAPAAAVAAAFTVTNWINERVPVNTILVFFGAAFEAAAPEISEIFFRSGPGGAGRTAAVVNVESCYTKMESDGYFGVPVTYDPQENCFIQVTNRIPIGAAGTILILKGYAIEPRREQVS
ncbi:MAG: hypothetical protein PHO67_08100 [Candidatus Omnitrophica bacterium]|nr:hypothetical protein [Candidatus Omnitrophota bacterium]